MLTIRLGILTPSLGQSSSCLRPQTKTEPANGKFNPESIGIKKGGKSVTKAAVKSLDNTAPKHPLGPL